jgi:hypothetical protein
MAAQEEAGEASIDIIAVLDCDHVPLPTFLTATLGWFVDDGITLVQGPQAFYNSGAFDDDGITGEQGMFFNVLMPARHHAGAGPFWCGSTSLLRVKALREVGGVATETIREDMHTTLKLIRAGWRTVYHHQTLALGLACSTSDQYLLQRRRWVRSSHMNGFGRPSDGCRGATTMNTSTGRCQRRPDLHSGSCGLRDRVPRDVLHPPMGCQAAHASPDSLAHSIRAAELPGTRGVACLWWLISRKTLESQVTPKGVRREQRCRGRAPPVPGWYWPASCSLSERARSAPGVCNFAKQDHAAPGNVALAVPHTTRSPPRLSDRRPLDRHNAADQTRRRTPSAPSDAYGVNGFGCAGGHPKQNCRIGVSPQEPEHQGSEVIAPISPSGTQSPHHEVQNMPRNSLMGRAPREQHERLGRWRYQQHLRTRASRKRSNARSWTGSLTAAREGVRR